MEERRKENKCPVCGGELEKKDGKIECLSCDYGQKDNRKKIPDALNDWIK